MQTRLRVIFDSETMQRTERALALPSNYATLNSGDRIVFLHSRRNVVLDAPKGEPLDRLDWPNLGKAQPWGAST